MFFKIVDGPISLNAGFLGFNAHIRMFCSSLSFPDLLGPVSFFSRVVTASRKDLASATAASSSPSSLGTV